MTLRELRAKYNITQKELAQKLDVTQVTVSNWENGISSMTQVAKLAISYIFQIDDWKEITGYKKRPDKFNEV